MSKKWEILANRVPYLLGTPMSVLLHTVFFVASFILVFIGVSADRVMLILTTIVSLEAIYLSLFIQMVLNTQHKKLRGIEEDIDDILEDTVSLTEEQKQEIKTKVKNNVTKKV